MVETEGQYDLFSGDPDANPKWRCAITGLEYAKRRMAELAATKPGPYFIYSITLGRVMISLDSGGRSKVESA